jgi:hypothetical protein
VTRASERVLFSYIKTTNLRKRVKIQGGKLNMFENDVTTTEEPVVDETVDVSVDESNETELQGEEDVNPAESQEQEQEPEQVDVNAIAAAARRKAEAQQAAIDREFADRFKNFTNPKTGKPITSQRDYLDALDAQEEMRAKEQLQQQGIDPSVIDNLIANNPLIRQAQQVMAETQQQQTINQINADVAELGRIDPSITSLDTVPQNVITMAMQRNMSLVDCYKILNFGNISSAKQEAIQQQAINQAKGKAHLNPVNGVATPDGDVEIPQSELATWREYFPEKSAAELKKMYNKELRRN